MNTEQEVRYRIQRVLTDEVFIKSYRWQIHLLSRCRIIAAPWIQTMAVGPSSDGEVALFFNPEFCSAHLDCLPGILLHESNHILLGHLGPGFKNAEDTWAMTMAQETTANEGLHEAGIKLVEGVVTIEHPAFKAKNIVFRQHQSTWERYALIKQGKHAADEMRTLSPLGGHEFLNEKPGLIKESFSKTIDSILEEIEADGKRSIQEDITEVLAPQTMGNGVTSEDDEMTIDIDLGGLAIADLLYRQLRGQWKSGYLYTRFSRRWPESGLPDFSRKQQTLGIVVMIDTSGSMDRQQLELANGILAGFKVRVQHVFVVEFDSVVKRSLYITGPLTSLQGGGGTDIAAPFRFVRKRAVGSWPIVCITDGESNCLPDKPMPGGVLWVITGNKRDFKPGFGRVLYLR